MTSPRRHDIDALRALAFALLILYHLGMLYVFGWGYHLKSSYAITHAAVELQAPMIFVNRWRMDLIFLISGISAAFLLRGEPIGAFFANRTWRLLLPLVFGMLVVIPIQPYAQGVTSGLVKPGFGPFLLDYWSHPTRPEGAYNGWLPGYTWNHLWYLAYLWVYTGLLALLARPLGSRAGVRVQAWFCGLRGAWLMLLPALPLCVFTLALQARFPDTGDLVHDGYRHPMYFTVFLYGYLVARDEGFWAEVLRLRWKTLGTALALGISYVFLDGLFSDKTPSQQVLCNLYLWMMLLAILGWGHALLNRPFRWLRWATESVYPWYVLHQSVLIGIAFWLIPLRLGPLAEPALVLLLTVLGCWSIGEVVKAIPVLRPCFGLKRSRRQAVTAAIGNQRPLGEESA